MAKRRKRSSDPEKRRSPAQLPQGGTGTEQEAEDAEPLRGEGEEGVKALSVVEMVAYLEQRANEQQVDCSKLLHPRSLGLVTVPKAGSPPPLEDPLVGPETWEGREEEGESVRVLDMVAKLESECLKRQTEREGSGGLSRSNSLRRSVCRVLLAGGASSASTPPRPDPTAGDSHVAEFRCEALPSAPVGSAGAESVGMCVEESGCSESGAEPCAQREIVEEGLEEEAARAESGSRAEQREEPLPGMLFFSLLKEQPQISEPPQDSPSVVPQYKQKEERGVEEEEEAPEEMVFAQGEEEEGVGTPERVPCPLRRLVSHRFLEMRFKIQLLLEPQEYMALLPHHIIVKIFSLLPTQTLAALKCTCQNFKFVIESYGVRPADSRWVCDLRYRDDPCKQCKRRYGRGDVSLCRWHHKPYCQALPYGPGYWMCCYGSHKDAPGCNVGLHDNRWVPAFHSINMPIYKKARESEDS